jgi:hypothetical protein
MNQEFLVRHVLKFISPRWWRDYALVSKCWNVAARTNFHLELTSRERGDLNMMHATLRDHRFYLHHDETIYSIFLNDMTLGYVHRTSILLTLRKQSWMHVAQSLFTIIFCDFMYPWEEEDEEEDDDDDEDTDNNVEAVLEKNYTPCKDVVVAAILYFLLSFAYKEENVFAYIQFIQSTLQKSGCTRHTRFTKSFLLKKRCFRSWNYSKEKTIMANFLNTENNVEFSLPSGQVSLHTLFCHRGFTTILQYFHRPLLLSIFDKIPGVPVDARFVVQLNDAVKASVQSRNGSTVFYVHLLARTYYQHHNMNYQNSVDWFTAERILHALIGVDFSYPCEAEISEKYLDYVLQQLEKSGEIQKFVNSFLCDTLPDVSIILYTTNLLENFCFYLTKNKNPSFLNALLKFPSTRAVLQARWLFIFYGACYRREMDILHWFYENKKLFFIESTYIGGEMVNHARMALYFACEDTFQSFISTMQVMEYVLQIFNIPASAYKIMTPEFVYNYQQVVNSIHSATKIVTKRMRPSIVALLLFKWGFGNNDPRLDCIKSVFSRFSVTRRDFVRNQRAFLFQLWLEMLKHNSRTTFYIDLWNWLIDDGWMDTSSCISALIPFLSENNFITTNLEQHNRQWNSSLPMNLQSLLVCVQKKISITRLDIVGSNVIEHASSSSSSSSSSSIINPATSIINPATTLLFHVPSQWKEAPGILSWMVGNYQLLPADYEPVVAALPLWSRLKFHALFLSYNSDNLHYNHLSS